MCYMCWVLCLCRVYVPFPVYNMQKFGGAENCVRACKGRTETVTAVHPMSRWCSSPPRDQFYSLPLHSFITTESWGGWAGMCFSTWPCWLRPQSPSCSWQEDAVTVTILSWPSCHGGCLNACSRAVTLLCRSRPGPRQTVLGPWIGHPGTQLRAAAPLGAQRTHPVFPRHLSEHLSQLFHYCIAHDTNAGNHPVAAQGRP